MLGLSSKVFDKDGLLKKILETRTTSIPSVMENEMNTLMTDIVNELGAYPPTSKANNPPPPYYERGVGYYGRFGKLTKLSQQLGTRWETELRKDPKGITGVIKNTATYSGYVHDQNLQPPFHASRGWKTAQKVVDTQSKGDGILKKLQVAVNGILHKFT